MSTKLLPALAIVAVTATTAFAQTTPPAATIPKEPPAAGTAPMPSTPASPSVPSPASMTLTDAQAKAWIDKVVYSSDGKNLGEVAAFARDASGKVTELHADLGGLLGIGERRVRIMPAQFKLENDRVALNMTAAQADSLPTIAKQ